jgi:hypothetical protein
MAGPPPGDQWHRVEAAHRGALARFARALRAVADACGDTGVRISARRRCGYLHPFHSLRGREPMAYTPKAHEVRRCRITGKGGGLAATMRCGATPTGAVARTGDAGASSRGRTTGPCTSPAAAMPTRGPIAPAAASVAGRTRPSASAPCPQGRTRWGTPAHLAGADHTLPHTASHSMGAWYVQNRGTNSVDAREKDAKSDSRVQAEKERNHWIHTA